MKKEEHILRIYIDESGDNGDAKGSSELIGVSFVFWDNRNDISKELNKLNNKLEYIGFTEMIHTNELLCRKGIYKLMSVAQRKYLFNILFYFFELSKIEYKSFFVRKTHVLNKDELNIKLTNLVINFIDENYEYLSSFDKVIVYYDNGQKLLGKIFDECFKRLRNYEHIIHFNKKEEKLFQVADMLTFIDKYRFKTKHKVYLNTKEIKFFSPTEIKHILKILNKKEFNH